MHSGRSSSRDLIVARRRASTVPNKKNRPISRPGFETGIALRRDASSA
jgi:hypothetical protein